MFQGWQWSRIFENPKALWSIISGQADLPRLHDGDGDLAASLHRALKAAVCLYQEDIEGAAQQLAQSEKARLSLSENLVYFWLSADVDEPEAVYLRLMQWQSVNKRHGRRSSIFPQSLLETRDRKAYDNFLPALRFYLAAQLDEWTEAIEIKAREDLRLAGQAGLPESALVELGFIWQFSSAHKKNSVDSIVTTARQWYALAQESPAYQMGASYILETAIALEHAGRLEEAMLWTHRGLKRQDSLHYEFMLTLARLCKLLGKNEESLAACDRLVERFGEDYAGYCLRSNIYFLIGYHDLALRDADKAIELAPENPNGYLARGFVNLQLGRYQLALDDFGQVLRREEKHYDALRGKGKCLSMLGRDYEALTCFKRLQRDFPDDPDLDYEIADVLFAAGFLNDCDRVCRQGLQKDAGFSSLYVILALIAQRHNDEEHAKNLLQRAVQLEPENSFALNELSYLLHLQGEDEEAIALVERAIAEAPDYADAICNKGIIHYYRSEFEKADAVFDEALSLIPDHVSALVGKGNTLTQLSEFDEALSCYDEALRVDPHNADACHGKALLYRMLGLEDEVRKWQERAHRFDPSLEEEG